MSNEEYRDSIPPLLHSLATIFRLAGRGISVHYLYANLSDGGKTPDNDNTQAISPEACLRAAKVAGLHGRILEKPTLDSISPLTLPCILLLKNGRSCVLLSIYNDADVSETDVSETGEAHETTGPTATIILSDDSPEQGPTQDDAPTTVPLAKLAQEYSGYAILTHLDAPPDARIAEMKNARMDRFMDNGQPSSSSPTPSPAGTTAWFWSAMKHYGPIYRHAFMASIVINTVAVATPLFTMNVYDRVIPNNAMETLWVLASGIAIIYFFDFLLRTLRSYFVDVAGRNADVVISSMLVNKILTMRLDAKPKSTGALVNNISQFEALRDFFSSSTLLACIDVPFLAIFLILLYFIGGPLVFLPLIAMPVLFMAGYLFQWAARRSAEAHYSQGMQKNALLVEIIHGLETLKSSMAENRMQRLWEEVVELSASSTVDSRKYTNRALAFSTLMTQCVTVAMIIWGVYRIEEGLLTMGGLIACNILASRAMAPLMQMAGLLTRFQNSRLSLSALNTLMALPSENNQALTTVDFSDTSTDTSSAPSSATSPTNPDTAKPIFTLESLSFAYPEAQRLALQNINLTIKAGEKVGIIGGMGSGKSTLAKLLMGLYQPRDGAVKLDGIDIRQMATSQVRSRMGFLPQDVVLFYGSIRDNIALGDVHPSDRRILRAAELAGVADFVRHNPAGFAAQVGEQGRDLSGGQRQSIALARALVRNPQILILDEPTSNMDTRSEKLVQAQLRSLANQAPPKTIIIITHRMSMLRLVDRIIVMDAGRVALDGRKDEVLRKLKGGKD